MHNIIRNGGKWCMQQKEYTGEDWSMEYLTFPGLSNLPNVRHMFTTRTGGVSTGIYESLNLSFTRGDDEESVRTNFSRVAQVLGTSPEQIVCSDQTHTTNVRIVTGSDAGKGIVSARNYTDVDGMITNEKGLVLATFFADCVPLYFVDPVKEVIALSHSGWRGTAGRMGEVTVQRMQDRFGCKVADIHAAIGPSICRDCYEVSSDVAEAFEETFAGDRAAYEAIFRQKNEIQREEGKYQLDLWKANELILLAAGILPEHLEVTDICTAHNSEYLFSHRRTGGKRGNLGAFLMMV